MHNNNNNRYILFIHNYILYYLYIFFVWYLCNANGLAKMSKLKLLITSRPIKKYIYIDTIVVKML